MAGQYEQVFTLKSCINGQPQWLSSELTLRNNPTTGHLMCFNYINDVTDTHISEEIARLTVFTNFDCFMGIFITTGCCLQYDLDASGNRLRSETRYGKTDIIYRLCNMMTEDDASGLIRDTELPLVISQLNEKAFYQVYATLISEDNKRMDKLLSYSFLDSSIGILAMTVTDVTEIRAAEVHHAQLLSDASKSQFLSRMSHEIRTPLNAVIGYGSITRNEMNKAKTEAEWKLAGIKVIECLEKSDIASKHLLEIINDVLDMSSIESGKIAITNDRFDFRVLINSLTASFYSLAVVKNIDLQVLFTRQMEDWLIGDQIHVNQILTNLLSNAVKFTPEDGKVVLSVIPDINDSIINVTFTVEDTGIGMSPEYIERIWKPFEQADSYISRRFGGTGLGMTITKNLVDLMGGAISVDSTPGRGTIFTVKLTFGRTEQPANNDDSRLSDTKLTVTDIIDKYDFDGIRILLAEDNAMNTEIAVTLLEAAGFTFDHVRNGQEAVNAFESATEGTYRIILMDIQMPVMDRYQATRTIRSSAHPEAATIPIIAMTADAFDENIAASLAAGMNDHILKPIDLPLLFETLNTYVHRINLHNQQKI